MTTSELQLKTAIAVDQHNSSRVVADGSCPAIQGLLGDALCEVLNLGPSTNPLAAVSQSLRDRSVDTLHLVAHGRPGAFLLSGRWIDAASLVAHAPELATWGVQQIALWSCELGADRDFTALLSELTGAEVFATSSKLQGGAAEHWQLNRAGGTRSTAPAPRPPFSPIALNAWKGDLATIMATDIWSTTESSSKLTLNPYNGSFNYIWFTTQNPEASSFSNQTGGSVAGTLYILDGTKITALSGSIANVDIQQGKGAGYYFIGTDDAGTAVQYFISYESSPTDYVSGQSVQLTSATNSKVSESLNQLLGALSITGENEEGGMLRGIPAIAGATTFSYQWQIQDQGIWVSAPGINNTQSYAIADDQSLVGKLIRVEVTASGSGLAEQTYSSIELPVANVDDEASASLSITGTPQEGGFLIAELTSLVDPDGETTVTYQWQELIDSSWIAIEGATNPSFAIPQDPTFIGKSLRLLATTTDSFGGTTSFTSDPLLVSNQDDKATGSLSITGTPAEGSTLNAILDASDPDGDIINTSFQWQELIDAQWVNLDAQTSPSLLIPTGQDYVGKILRVQASTTDSLGGQTLFFSNGSTIDTTGGFGPITDVDQPATGSLSITGTPAEGSTLNAILDASDPDGDIINTSFQWQELIDAQWVNLDAQTSPSLLIPTGQDYVGKILRVQASTTDSLGGQTLFFSNGSTIDTTGGFGPITDVDQPATGSLSITGTPAEGSTLNAILDASDPDGDIINTSFQWQELIDAQWVNLDAQTSPSLLIPTGQDYVGKILRVQASTTDSLGGQTLFFSNGSTIDTTLVPVEPPVIEEPPVDVLEPAPEVLPLPEEQPLITEPPVDVLQPTPEVLPLPEKPPLITDPPVDVLQPTPEVLPLPEEPPLIMDPPVVVVEPTPEVLPLPEEQPLITEPPVVVVDPLPEVRPETVEGPAGTNGSIETVAIQQVPAAGNLNTNSGWANVFLKPEANDGNVADMTTAKINPTIQISGTAGLNINEFALKSISGQELDKANFFIQETTIYPQQSIYNLIFKPEFAGLAAGSYTLHWQGKDINNADSALVIDPSMARRTIPANPRLRTSGTKKADLVTGTLGSERLKSGNKDDLINPQGDRLTEGSSIFSNQPGLNAKDRVDAGKGRDVVMLGDAYGSFYAEDGRNGFANIKNFEKKDSLLLSGEASDYSFKLLQKKRLEISLNDGAPNGDLIAIVQGKGIKTLATPGSTQALFMDQNRPETSFDILSSMAAPQPI